VKQRTDSPKKKNLSVNMGDNPGSAGVHDEDDEEEFYPPENFAMVGSTSSFSPTAYADALTFSCIDS